MRSGSLALATSRSWPSASCAWRTDSGLAFPLRARRPISGRETETRSGAPILQLLRQFHFPVLALFARRLSGEGRLRDILYDRLNLAERFLNFLCPLLVIMTAGHAFQRDQPVQRPFARPGQCEVARQGLGKFSPFKPRSRDPEIQPVAQRLLVGGQLGSGLLEVIHLAFEALKLLGGPFQVVAALRFPGIIPQLRG